MIRTARQFPHKTPNATARALLISGAILGLSAPVQAETQGILDSQTEVLDRVASATTTTYGFRQGSFVLAPIPFSNPTVGAGLMLGAGYLFTTDEGSKPSMIGIGALRSDNGSRGYGLAVNLAFDNNRWLFKSFFAQADARYDLYTPIAKIPIRQDGVLSRISLSYGVSNKLSFGVGLRYLNTTISPNVPGLPAIPPPFNQFLDVEIASVGVISDWDRRDDTIYPTSGSNLHVEAYHNVSLSGLLVADYQKGYATYAKYFQLGSSGVVAAQFSACAASAETPFFDQCALGPTDAFRGFSATQFLDRRSVSAQIEYRHQLTKRIGMAAFGGIGLVGPQLGDLTTGGSHSAIGFGARYRISKKFPLDFSVDLARNNLSENQLYVYVGQRF